MGLVKDVPDDFVRASRILKKAAKTMNLWTLGGRTPRDEVWLGVAYGPEKLEELKEIEPLLRTARKLIKAGHKEIIHAIKNPPAKED